MYRRLSTKNDLIVFFKEHEPALGEFYVIYQKLEYQVVALSPRKIYRFHVDLKKVDVYTRKAGGQYTQDCVSINSKSPLDFLHLELQKWRVLGTTFDTPFFKGGLVGAASFEGLSQLLGIEAPPDGVPPFCFGLFDSYFVKNVENGQLHVVGGAETEDQFSWLLSQLELNEYKHSTPSSGVIEFSKFHCKVSGDRKAKTIFFEQVKKIKQHLRKGNSFQTVLSHKYIFDQKNSPFDILLNLYSNDSTYKFLARFFDVHVAGISPENLFTVDRQGVVTMVPLAGTRSLTDDPRMNNSREMELSVSEKENAEHAMLVDLARNDLGMVCEDGSVLVSRYKYIARCKGVVHLATDIKGRLKKNKTALDLMRAASPAGTMSGAPKIRSINIIKETENDARGYYSGNIGFVNHDGSADFAIIIRSGVFLDKKIHLRAGAGIVLDSVAEAEYEECLHKMYSFGKALG